MNLLRDALERTLLDPHCAPRWHRLTAIWEATQDAAVRAEVLDRLAGGPVGDAQAEILRLSFLGTASGNMAWEGMAAVQVLAARPEDPDQLAAYLAYHWLHALQERDGRADFVAAMAAGRRRWPPPSGSRRTWCRVPSPNRDGWRWCCPTSATASTHRA